MGRRAGRTIALSVVIGAATLAACTPKPDSARRPDATSTRSTTPFVATSCTAAQAAGAVSGSVPIERAEAEAERSWTSRSAGHLGENVVTFDSVIADDSHHHATRSSLSSRTGEVLRSQRQ